MTEARFTSSTKDLSGELFVYRQQRSPSFKDLAAALMKSSSSLVPAVRGISLDKQLEMFAVNEAKPPGSTFTHTSSGIAMRRTRYIEESMSSLSKRRSGTHRVRQLVITSLATPGTAALLILISAMR